MPRAARARGRPGPGSSCRRRATATARSSPSAVAISTHSSRWSVALRRTRRVGVRDRAELVVGVLEEVRVDRADAQPALLDVRAARQVVDRVPREVQRDGGRGAGQPVHLGGVVDALEHVARAPGLLEGGEARPGVAVAPRRGLDLEGRDVRSRHGLLDVLAGHCQEALVDLVARRRPARRRRARPRRRPRRACRPASRARRRRAPARARCRARSPRPGRRAPGGRAGRPSAGTAARCATPPPITCTTSTSRPVTRSSRSSTSRYLQASETRIERTISPRSSRRGWPPRAARLGDPRRHVARRAGSASSSGSNSGTSARAARGQLGQLVVRRRSPAAPRTPARATGPSRS